MMLPDWPAGTVTILVTVDPAPHAIPVSAALRIADDRLLLGLADRRGSLARLRATPEVAVTVLAEGLAITARGRARVLEEPAADGVRAVEVVVSAVDDHDRPTFSLDSGVGWHWTDDAARERDRAVRAGLERLAAAGH